MGMLVRTVLASSIAVQAACGWTTGAVAQATSPPSAPVAAGPSLVHLQPDAGPTLTPYVIDPASEPAVSRDALIAALRKKVRYVFVVFNENHSFDNEYGSFPGADGLFSDGTAPRDADHTPGFVQRYKDWQGTDRTAQPFLIGPDQKRNLCRQRRP